MLGKWAVSTKAISWVGGHCFCCAQMLLVFTAPAFDFLKPLVSLCWISVQCGYEKGGILTMCCAGVSANWWIFPRGCDYPVSSCTGVPWDIPLCCLVAGWHSCRKKSRVWPQDCWAELKLPLSTGYCGWSKPWAATREKQRALFWVPVRKRAYLERDISTFPFVFSLIIPFSLSWHLPALPVWWGSAGSP